MGCRFHPTVCPWNDTSQDKQLFDSPSVSFTSVNVVYASTCQTERRSKLIGSRNRLYLSQYSPGMLGSVKKKLKIADLC
jgi:hypothetical protein